MIFFGRKYYIRLIFSDLVLGCVPSNRWDRFFNAAHSKDSLGHQTGIELGHPYFGFAPQ